MAVHDLGYERWDGSLQGRRLRWVPMVGYHVSLILKRKFIWLLLLASLIPALVFSAAIYITSDSAREGTGMEQAMSAVPAGQDRLSPVDLMLSQFLADRTPQGEDEEPKAPLTMEEKYWLITTHGLFFLLLWPQSFIVMFVASAVGAGLIAQDIRSNALEIYLTKPITPLDYILGKLSVVSVFILFTTFLPAMIVFGVAAASWQGFFGVAWPVIPLLFGVCLIASVVNGIVILGLSSLAKSARYATVIWFAIGFISSASASFLRIFTEENLWNFVSYRDNFLYLFAKCLDINLARIPGAQDPTASVWIPISVLGVLVLLSALVMRRTIRAVEAS
ncbi:MAG: ABC-2 type transport system permease protein [Planctomycetota bacterium]|jgi:ABC-2 type transport system permease protein